MITYPDFTMPMKAIREDLIHNGQKIHSGTWQGMDISKKPEAEMRELLNINFGVHLNGIESLHCWRQDIKPNLPWADDHFLERVGGEPLNPGEQWKNWPWAKSADQFRTQGEKFDHTYMERFWPKYAGSPVIGNDPPLEGQVVGKWDYQTRKGIRFEYADLDDLINLLHLDPLTRQAYLPIWFPEDGAPEAKRKPCTLGYWFINRGGKLHIHYPIRSCDITRHFADDCYMAVRLLLWILDKLRVVDPYWESVVPGDYSMWIGSAHCFVGDLYSLKKLVR